METFPSTEAKDKWGLIADTALREPVTITKHGRATLVVTSIQDSLFVSLKDIATVHRRIFLRNPIPCVSLPCTI